MEVAIYKDTVTRNYNGDDNLIYINLPEEYVRKYATENENYSSFEEWKDNYTADETVDLFDRVTVDGVAYCL